MDILINDLKEYIKRGSPPHVYIFFPRVLVVIEPSRVRLGLGLFFLNLFAFFIQPSASTFYVSHLLQTTATLTCVHSSMGGEVVFEQERLAALLARVRPLFDGGRRRRGHHGVGVEKLSLRVYRLTNLHYLIR